MLVLPIYNTKFTTKILKFNNLNRSRFHSLIFQYYSVDYIKSSEKIKY